MAVIPYRKVHFGSANIKNKIDISDIWRSLKPSFKNSFKYVGIFKLLPNSLTLSLQSPIPIIALTANAFDEDVQQSLQAGMTAHLSKPVEIDQLYKTLENLIGKPSH